MRIGHHEAAHRYDTYASRTGVTGMKNSVTAHYTHGRLLDRILVGIEAIGKTPDTVTVDELAPVDEFAGVLSVCLSRSPTEAHQAGRSKVRSYRISDQ